MNRTLDQVRALLERGEVHISDHGYDELADDGIFADEVLTGAKAAVVVEDYPDAIRGSSVLVLQHDASGQPVHVVWAIPKGRSGPAVLVTAYRPDATRWSADYLKRKSR
jgi:hypothetical protein